MTRTTEKVSQDNVSIERLLAPEFVELLRKEFGDRITTAGIFLVLKPSIPIVINHESQQDVQAKRVHINSPDESALNNVSRILEKVS